MVESSGSTLPYSYAPLASNGEANGFGPAEKQQRRRSLKIGLLVFSGLMISALIMSFMDFGKQPNVANMKAKKPDDLSLRPPPENLAGVQVMPGSNDLLFTMTRGKPHGVSEKANGLPQRGLKVPFFDWNDLQLSWQRTAFHFQPQKNWMNGIFHFI